MHGRDGLKEWPTGFLPILAAICLVEENSGGLVLFHNRAVDRAKSFLTTALIFMRIRGPDLILRCIDVTF